MATTKAEKFDSVVMYRQAPAARFKSLSVADLGHGFKATFGELRYAEKTDGALMEMPSKRRVIWSADEQKRQEQNMGTANRWGVKADSPLSLEAIGAICDKMVERLEALEATVNGLAEKTDGIQVALDDAQKDDDPLACFNVDPALIGAQKSDDPYGAFDEMIRPARMSAEKAEKIEKAREEGRAKGDPYAEFIGMVRL